MDAQETAPTGEKDPAGAARHSNAEAKRKLDAGRILAREPLKSRAVHRRRPRHQAYKPNSEALRNKGQLALASWLYVRLSDDESISADERGRFVARTWQSEPSHIERLRHHIEWRRIEDAARDRVRWRTWRLLLKSCGGAQAEADRLMALLHPVASGLKLPLPVAASKDWAVRAPGPDPMLLAQLQKIRARLPVSASPIRNAPCEQCGVPVELKRRRVHVFCSDRCRRAFHNAKRARVVHSIRVCPECGCGFEAARRDAKFCSSACRQHRYRCRPASVSAKRNATSDGLDHRAAHYGCAA